MKKLLLFLSLFSSLSLVCMEGKVAYLDEQIAKVSKAFSENQIAGITALNELLANTPITLELEAKLIMLSREFEGNAISEFILLKLSGVAGVSPKTLATCKVNLAVGQLKRQEFEKAESSFIEAGNAAKKANDQQVYFHIFGHFGRSYLEVICGKAFTGNKEAALDTTIEALTAAVTLSARLQPNSQEHFHVLIDLGKALCAAQRWENLVCVVQSGLSCEDREIRMLLHNLHAAGQFHLMNFDKALPSMDVCFSQSYKRVIDNYIKLLNKDQLCRFVTEVGLVKNGELKAHIYSHAAIRFMEQWKDDEGALSQAKSWFKKGLECNPSSILAMEITYHQLESARLEGVLVEHREEAEAFVTNFKEAMPAVMRGHALQFVAEIAVREHDVQAASFYLQERVAIFMKPASKVDFESKVKALIDFIVIEILECGHSVTGTHQLRYLLADSVAEVVRHPLALMHRVRQLVDGLSTRLQEGAQLYTRYRTQSIKLPFKTLPSLMIESEWKDFLSYFQEKGKLKEFLEGVDKENPRKQAALDRKAEQILARVQKASLEISRLVKEERLKEAFDKARGNLDRLKSIDSGYASNAMLSAIVHQSLNTIVLDAVCTGLTTKVIKVELIEKLNGALLAMCASGETFKVIGTYAATLLSGINDLVSNHAELLKEFSAMVMAHPEIYPFDGVPSTDYNLQQFIDFFTADKLREFISTNERISPEESADREAVFMELD